MSENTDKKNKEVVIQGSKSSWFSRKLKRFSKASNEFWVMGKQGFIMGSICGAVLGGILGTYESIRSKSFLPLPLSIFMMAGFFGGIMGVSSLIRNHNDEKILFRVIYIDKGLVEYKLVQKAEFFQRI
jgi:hypothetical protein